jgi:hypothetical protein
MLRNVLFLFLSLTCIARAAENLRGTGNVDLEELVSRLVNRVDTLELSLGEQKLKNQAQDEIIDSLTQTLELQIEVQHKFSRRLNETDGSLTFGNITKDDSFCLPTYDAATDSCIFHEEATFRDDVIFEDDIIFQDEVIFKDEVYFEGIGLVDFKVPVRFGPTDDGTNTVEFGYKVHFENNVKFEDDVEFEDDAKFYDDVKVEGPSDSSADGIDFQISGKVFALFEQDETFVVDTETLIRKDLRIALSEDDDRRKLKHSDSSSSSEDIPNLYVEGDTELVGDVELATGDDSTVTIGGDLTVGGELEVEGLTVNAMSTFKEKVTMEAPLETNMLTVNEKATFNQDIDAQMNVIVQAQVTAATVVDCSLLANALLPLCVQINLV